MRLRVLTIKLRVEIENEMRVFLESLNSKIEMRVSQSGLLPLLSGIGVFSLFFFFDSFLSGMVVFAHLV